MVFSKPVGYTEALAILPDSAAPEAPKRKRNSARTTELPPGLSSPPRASSRLHGTSMPETPLSGSG